MPPCYLWNADSDEMVIQRMWRDAELWQYAEGEGDAQGTSKHSSP